MKLYSWDISPYSARVRMQIYAKGLTDIAIEQPPTYGTLKFYQDHPIGRIPLLEIDGEAIPESAVIAEYLEEIHPEPSLLGATPRENAHIRTLARIGDIYLMNNAFMLAVQTRALAAQTPVTTGNESIVALLSGQLAQQHQALDRMIGRDGFACLGRLTLADCALVPALFYVETCWGTGVSPTRSPRTPTWPPTGPRSGTGARGAHPGGVRTGGVEERRELVRTGDSRR